MLEYKGYNIIVEPEYKSAIENGENPFDYMCEVYDKTDSAFERCLAKFNIMHGFEFKENTAQDVEGAIKRITDESEQYIELSRTKYESQRCKDLLSNALEYLSEIQDGEELYNTLRNHLEMTDEEILKNGFDYLTEYFGNDEICGMKLS